MRRITRNFLLGVLVVVVLLLGLGALPSLLKSGDPYYVTATEVDIDHPAVDAGNLSERRFEYTVAALADANDGPGYSEPYWKGPIGIKGAFTHSPFDELESLQARYPNATDESAVYVRENVTLYRLNVTQKP
ncbi:MAG: hypothetical protein V5A34_12905 [Halapricum sp.]